MKAWLKTLIAALAAAAVCITALSLYERRGNESELWYVYGELPEAAVKTLVQEYNSGFGTRSKVTVQSFSSEASMIEELYERRPDILLCGAATAQWLADRGALRECRGQNKELTQWLYDAAPCSGHGFYPAAVSAQVLLCDEAAFSAAGVSLNTDSLPELMDSLRGYTEKTGVCAGSMDSLWGIMAGTLGDDFTGDMTADRKNESFCRVYNLFARAVYDGALTAGDRDYVCRIISCTSLMEAELEQAQPIPGLAGQGSICPADVLGFAVVSDNPAAGSFVRFASGEVADALAAASGMYGMEAATEKFSSCRMVLSEYDGSACRLRDEFEAKARQALDLLK